MMVGTKKGGKMEVCWAGGAGGDQWVYDNRVPFDVALTLIAGRMTRRH